MLADIISFSVTLALSYPDVFCYFDDVDFIIFYFLYLTR